MDHLPEPSYVTNRMRDVPYLCGSAATQRYRYDNHGWLSYPDRMGWDKDAMFYRDGPDDKRYDSEEAAALLQSWLFFGLFFEFLGQPLDQRSFVKLNEEAKPIVTMATLDSSLEQWIVRVRNSSQFSNQQLLSRINELSRVFALYVSPEQSQLLNGKTPLPYEVALSVFLLANYLEIAKCHVSSQLPGCIRIPTPIPEAMKQRMMADSWCPADIPFLQANISPLTGIYYLSLIGPRDPDSRHGQCAQHACQANRIATSQYHIRHAPAHCQCTSWRSMEIDYLVEAVSNHEVPLVTVGSSSFGSRLVPFSATQSTHYVAVSHVWSHGLGNEDANALPTCQLQNIQHLVNKLYPHRNNVPFWLDTLSIPARGSIHKDARAQAIQDMTQAYSKADKILVLDKDLLSTSLRIPHLELAARLSLCDWLRRIWTLQEGIRAKELYFQFLDGHMSILQILQRIHTTQNNKMFRPEQTLMIEFLRPFSSMLELRDSQFSNPYSRVRTLSEVLASIQWRVTEHPRDILRVVDTLADPTWRSEPAQGLSPLSRSNGIAQRENSQILRSAPVEQPRAGSAAGLFGTILGLGVLGAGHAVRHAIRQSQNTGTSSRPQTATSTITSDFRSPTSWQTPSVWRDPAAPVFTTTGLNEVQLLLHQGTATSDLLFQEGLKMSDPGWRWCPRSLPQRGALGAFGGGQPCTITPNGLQGTFYGIRIRPTAGAVLYQSFNLYDETNGNIYAVADLIASDQGAGSFAMRNLFQPRARQVPSKWLDSISNPALILKSELVRGRIENSVAVVVDITNETAGVLRATYCRGATLGFMDDLTVQSYRGAAAQIGGYQALARHSSMLDEFRLGNAVGNRIWLVG